MPGKCDGRYRSLNPKASPLQKIAERINVYMFDNYPKVYIEIIGGKPYVRCAAFKFELVESLDVFFTGPQTCDEMLLDRLKPDYVRKQYDYCEINPVGTRICQQYAIKIRTTKL